MSFYGVFSGNDKIVKQTVIEYDDHHYTVFQYGKWIAQEKVNVVAYETFVGQGLIQSPTIRILTRKFQFTGTIDCSGNCIILSQEPFDPSQFTRAGQGLFKIAPKEEVSAVWVQQEQDDHHKFCEWRERRIRELVASAPPLLPKLTEEENQYVKRLAEIPLESLFEGGEGRKVCGALCEEIHDRFEKRDGNGDKELTRIFEALLFESKDGHSRKYNVEQAWHNYSVEQRWRRYHADSLAAPVTQPESNSQKDRPQ